MTILREYRIPVASSLQSKINRMLLLKGRFYNELCHSVRGKRTSVAWPFVRSTIIRAIAGHSAYLKIVILADGGRRNQTSHGVGANPAELIEGAVLETKQHVAMAGVIANAGDETASRLVQAFEWIEIDVASVLDLHGLGECRE
jgi:hypothetical protein